MIFKANLGFRNVSMAMTVLCCECKIERAPSHEICVQWALKVGFYKLSVLKKREDCQWIWIVDHAVKAGVDKCLIVLGIRLDQIKGRRCTATAMMAPRRHAVGTFHHRPASASWHLPSPADDNFLAPPPSPARDTRLAPHITR